MRRFAVVPLVLVLAGCRESGTPTTSFPAPPEPWSIVCNSPPAEGIYLSNGLMGMKIGALGDAGSSGGNGSPMFRADRYAGHNIAQQPNPFFSRFSANRRPITPDFEVGYRQVLSMRDGVLTTHYMWQAGRVSGKTTVELFLSRAEPGLAAARYEISVDRACALRVEILPTGMWQQTRISARPAQPYLLCSYEGAETTLSEWVSYVHVQDSIGHLARGENGWRWEGELQAGGSVVVEHVIRIVRGENVDRMLRFDQALKLSREAWNALWKGDIEIEGNVADQQLVRSWLFNLYQSTGAGFFPPMGLSSDWYGGRIFWDQEIWMLPSLLPFHPHVVADAISRRIALLPKAIANARRKGFEGALYPWESTPDGEEGAPPEFQQEIHITGDVLFAARQALNWGVKLEGYSELAIRVAEFWASRIQNGQILRVISPDEADLVDNDLFTNVLAAWCLREGARHDPRRARYWRELAEGLRLPRDAEGVYLTYENDPGITYKQAAALLALYPLGMRMDRGMQERMFDRYKDKVIETGPAMADAIHAVIACRLGRHLEAEHYFRKSYKQFVKDGLQFSEKRKGTPRTYFLTGAGGCLQAVLYGFAGLEVLPRGEKGWKGVGPSAEKPLPGGYTLRATACLPKGWESLTLRNVKVRGKVYDIRLTRKEVLIEGG